MNAIPRRAFLAAAGALSAGVALGRPTLAADPPAGQIKKSLKWGMVDLPGSLVDKFKVLKEIGYDGVELDSPTKLDVGEVLKARDASGLVINGTVFSDHWTRPLSDPDPAVRAASTDLFKRALHETKRLGGTSVLLVPAVVSKTVSYDDAYKRSQQQIKLAIPVAEETGVRIALENVWNNFLVSPLEAARYIDEFGTPAVCAHFDVGNVLRYGWPEQWIRILGPRIFKLDVKEYSLKKMADEGVYKGFNVPIGEGDCDWPAVMKALREIGYTSGWGAAEVPGGGRDQLVDISRRMDRVLAGEAAQNPLTRSAGAIRGMGWAPITERELHSEIAADLAHAEPALLAFWKRVRITPEKWSLSPWGDEPGGFWVVAVAGNRCVWFNDIEGDFDLSEFSLRDSLETGATSGRCGPPGPLR